MSGRSGGDVTQVTNAFNPRLPNGILVAILMCIGFVGNSLVLYIYHFKMPRTVFSTFVTVLALLDLCTTVCSMPLDVVMKTIIIDSHQTLNILCKIAHCEVYGTSLASGSVLLLIAVTRYRKVCHPLKSSLNRRQAKALCSVIFFVSMALSTITLVIHGPESVKIILDDQRPSTKSYSNLGKVTNSQNPPFQTHQGVNVTGQPASLQLNNTVDENGSAGNTGNRTEPTGEIVVPIEICRVSEQHKGTALYYALSSILMAAFAIIFLLLVVLHCRISHSINTFQRRRSDLMRSSIQSDDSTNSLTSITTSMYRIFVTITIVFLVSYLPHLICLIVEPVVYKSNAPMPQHWRMIMDVAYNSPYMNVIANPFIYGYRSAVFRRYCLKLLASCFCCHRRYK